MWWMETAQQRIGFDEYGRVFWLSGAAGVNRVIGRPADLLRLTVCDNGRNVPLRPVGAPTVQEGPQGLELGWTALTAPDGLTVSLLCQVSVRAHGDGFAFTLSTEAGLRVADALFPVIGGLRGDALYFPHHAGERILDPARTLASERYQSNVECPSTRMEDGTFGREITYCGQASMAWLELDASGRDGLYLGAHDPHFGLTGLRVETDGKELSLALRSYGPAGPGRWETAPAVLSAHGGDWRTGAGIYREWISPLLPRPQRSALADAHAAIGTEWEFRKDGAIAHTLAEIPDLAEAAARSGIDHLVIGGWQRSGRSPEFYPDLELGTLSDLADGCRTAAENGRMVSLSLDVRRFDTASEYYPTLGSRWALKSEMGWPTLEQSGEQRFAVMCPAEAGWQRQLTDSARWLVKSTGAQGLYLGQLGAGTPSPCYDQAHHHGSTGEYNQGYIRLLDELKADATLLIENGGDIYSSRAWASVAWNGEPYDEFCALYRYTFPEHRMICSVQPRSAADGTSRERLFYRDLERAWLLGSYFLAAPRGGFGTGDERLLAHLARVTALRRAAEPFLAEAHYRDTEGLVVDGAKVSRFDGPGYMALAVSNPLGVPGHVLVPEAPASVTCLELGRDVARPWSKDGRRVLLPTAGLSLLVLRMS